MRLLVTGGAGFIGSHLVEHWLAHHPDDRIVVVDLLTYAADAEAVSGLGPAVTLLQADVADSDAMADALRDHAVDVVVHLAAESHNSLAVVDPQRFVHTNVVGTFGVLDAARRVGVARFHHVSTCEVYGDLALDDPGRFGPDAPYRPGTPYSATKAAADHLVRAYHATYGMDVTISNGANTYGPRQFPEKVIPLFVARALRDEPLPVYASADHRREWVNFLCRAHLRQRGFDSAHRTKKLRVHLTHLRIVRIGDDRRSERGFGVDPVPAHEPEVAACAGADGSAAR